MAVTTIRTRDAHVCAGCGKTIEAPATSWLETGTRLRWHYKCAPVVARGEGAVVLLGRHGRGRCNLWRLSGAIAIKRGKRNGDRFVVAQYGAPCTVVYTSAASFDWGGDEWIFKLEKTK